MELIKVINTHAISRQQSNFFWRAYDLAMMSTERQKHGCIIVSNRRVLGVGVNTFRNNPRTTSQTDGLSTHAEVNALRQLSRTRSSLTAYVVRVNNDGNVMNSCPCDNCQIWLADWNVKKVFHS